MPERASPIAPITDMNPNEAGTAARAARLAALAPTDDDLDARILGCERTSGLLYRHLRQEPAGIARGRDPGMMDRPAGVRRAADAAGVELPHA